MADALNGIQSASVNELQNAAGTSSKNAQTDFSQMLKDSIDHVNALQKESEKAMGDLATGNVKDLHQAAIAIGKAEMSMKMMLEVRNKAISAYKEILRTQI